MKSRNHIIRIGLTILIGVLLLHKTYQFKYSDFLFDVIIYSILGTIGLVAWGIILLKDLKLYKEQKREKYLTTSIIGGISLVMIFGVSWNINKNFKKPTLVKVFYDGDFNGTGIDFKKDGTYIFDNFCLGSNYKYGTYQINGDRIELDRNEIDNVIKSNHLQITSKITNYQDKIQEESYALQIDEFGNEIKNGIEFRITIDNRKRINTNDQ